MEITQNQTNTTETPNINPPLSESEMVKESMAPKSRLHLPRPLSKLLLLGLIIFLLVILGQAIAAYKINKQAYKIKKQLSNLHLTTLCPIKEAFDQTLGFSPFENIDCSADYPGKQSTAPQTPSAKCQQTGQYYPECHDYYENNCSHGIYSTGCQVYCDNQAAAGFLSGACSQYFKAFCVSGDHAAQGCRVFIEQEYPDAADFCNRFPGARVCQELGF